MISHLKKSANSDCWPGAAAAAAALWCYLDVLDEPGHPWSRAAAAKTVCLSLRKLSTRGPRSELVSDILLEGLRGLKIILQKSK